MTNAQKIQKTLQLLDLARGTGSADELNDIRHDLNTLAATELSPAMSLLFENANSLLKSYQLRRPNERQTDAILQDSYYRLTKQARQLAEANDDGAV